MGSPFKRLKQAFNPTSRGNTATEDQRRGDLLYLFFIVGAITLTGFAIYNLFYTGDKVMAILDGAFVLFLIVVRKLLDSPRWKHWVFRLIVLGYLLLNVYHCTTANSQPARILWFFIFPLLSFFFLGKREGALGVLVSLVILALFFRLPLLGDHSSNWIAINFNRFLGVYLLTSVMAYLFESSRHLYQMRILLEQERLKQKQVTLEGALRDAKAADTAKTQFLANMSHELRTPLNGIIGMNSLLQTTEHTDEQGEFIKAIALSANSLLSIIDDILDLSKIEAGKLTLREEPCDVLAEIEALGEAFALEASRKELCLIIDLPTDLKHQVVIDIQKVRQVLSNLIANAIKFTPTGEVVVSMEAKHVTGESVSLWFQVADSGIGIPKEALPEIFKAFQQVDASMTRQYGGAGLGLAISQQIAGAMGTTIAVESEEGSGSRFSFSLTAQRGSPLPDVSPTLDHVGQVFAVFSNDHQRHIFQKYLGALGLKAHTFKSYEKMASALPEQQRGP